ncbi:hypothetical protein ASPBRDRAFT_28186 [Aspergillus brasiliensis CBS 101740]|uniref:Uncharacterized protein n=1 Tax=Aspergillus brasiliensis (strain CBS 101740 / IMI 381727 / IBT 21946) TaxID=767769 RepID=A0A1L9UU44_ASPBC|nr:hypothetical protein ASPBRDRAFT_28186 [Aspergillus brasiliensis CBS 101740]
MSNTATHNPTITITQISQVRKLYMTKMIERGYSRTLRDKCRDIWDEVIIDAVEANAECSSSGRSGVVNTDGYTTTTITTTITTTQKNKDNGKKEKEGVDTESESESSESSSNSETEVEVDASLDGSDCGVEYPESLVSGSGNGSEAESLVSSSPSLKNIHYPSHSLLTPSSSSSRAMSYTAIHEIQGRFGLRMLHCQKNLDRDIKNFVAIPAGVAKDDFDGYYGTLHRQATVLKELRGNLVRPLIELGAILDTAQAEMKDALKEEQKRRGSEQLPQYQLLVARSLATGPTYPVSPKMKPQESDGDADPEKETMKRSEQHQLDHYPLFMEMDQWPVYPFEKMKMQESDGDADFEKEKVKRSRQHQQQQLLVAKSLETGPKRRQSPVCPLEKKKVQESDGDADSEREVEIDNWDDTDAATLFW